MSFTPDSQVADLSQKNKVAAVNLELAKAYPDLFTFPTSFCCAVNIYSNPVAWS